ncbi:MAG: hypothetical protein AABX19_02155 [Nanoarchaeota archaeon]
MGDDFYKTIEARVVNINDLKPIVITTESAHEGEYPIAKLLEVEADDPHVKSLRCGLEFNYELGTRIRAYIDIRSPVEKGRKIPEYKPKKKNHSGCGFGHCDEMRKKFDRFMYDREVEFLTSRKTELHNFEWPEKIEVLDDEGNVKTTFYKESWFS